MKYEVVVADNTNYRLTVTPERATLKLVPGREEREYLRVIIFAGQVTGEMLAKGVHQTWRGKIKMHESVLRVSMYMGDNRRQHWHHKETK